MNDYQLAQINIARAREALDSELMKGFVERIDEINNLAEKSPGFVWRLQTEQGDATLFQAFNDPALIINMSIWKDLDSLKHYVYKSMHVELVRGRDEWFSKMLEAHQALWWVPTGHIPTVEEGKQKLQFLQQNRPTEFAFTFAKPCLTP